MTNSEKPDNGVENLIQNAQILKHGCFNAEQHTDVRKRPYCKLRFFIRLSPCSLASRYPS